MAASSFHIWKCKMKQDICRILKETVQSITKDRELKMDSAKGNFIKTSIVISMDFLVLIISI